MKKLLWSIVLCTLFSACENQQRYTQTSAEIETAKAIIEDYDAKNYESLMSHFADTANVYFNSSTAFKANKLAGFHENDDINFSSRGFSKEGQEYEMVVTDDGLTWVNFWGTWHGTLAANGKKIEIPIHLTVQFINGEAVAQYGYWDNAPMVLAIQEIEASFVNKQIVESGYNFFEKGDVPAFLALLDPKVEWNEAENFIYASKKPYKGIDATVKGVFEPIGADWEYWKLTNLQLSEMDNGQVLATGRYKAKHKKTGKKLNAQMAHVWTLKNGKVTKFQQYTDTKQVAEVVK